MTQGMGFTRRWAALAVLAILPACASGKQPAELSAEAVLARSHCGEEGPRPSARWIGNESDLRSVLERLHRGQVGTQVEPPEVDFASDGILLLTMGQKPTAGYGLEAAGEPVVREDGTLEVTVRWLEPAAGKMNAQVITSPCVLLRLPSGDYKSVRVVDQEGRVRLEQELAN